jgi:hypothetical protein
LRTEPSSTQAFAIEAAELGPEVNIVLSEYFEHLSAAMVEWLTDKDSVEAELFETDENPMNAESASVAA